MRDEITLVVPQGIGDIFWCHRRFRPLARKVHYRILGTRNDPLRERVERAAPFVQLWDGAGDVSYRYVHLDDYTALARSILSVREAYESPYAAVDFIMNQWHERGNRCEALDPEFPTDWAIPVADTACELPFPAGGYLCVFVSGDRPGFAWTTDQWATAVVRLRQRFRRPPPVLLLGATYDQYLLEAVRASLERSQVVARMVISPPPGEAIYLIRRCGFFFNYQSGLGVLADNLSVPQCHMIFPHYQPELFAWCEPGHAESGVFNSFMFSEDPVAVADKIRLPGHLADRGPLA